MFHYTIMLKELIEEMNYELPNPRSRNPDYTCIYGENMDDAIKQFIEDAIHNIVARNIQQTDDYGGCPACSIASD